MADAPLLTLSPQEFSGYVMKITGGCDKQGFSMKQGVNVNHRVRLLLKKGSGNFRAKRTGHRRRRSVRGSITDGDLAVLNLAVVRKGASDIEGLTDTQVPRRLGPKRASKIRKLFNLTAADDVRDYVVRREVARKAEGAKPRVKAPKIQRLVTPARIQRKRTINNLKQARFEKKKAEAAAYIKLVHARHAAAKTA